MVWRIIQLKMENNIIFKKRSLGWQILLYIITFGIYYLYWLKTTNSELKKYDKNAPNFYYFVLNFIIAFTLAILSLFIPESIIFGIIFLILVIVCLSYICLIYPYKYAKSANIVSQDRLSKWLGYILFFIPFGFLYFQNTYNKYEKKDRKLKNEIPHGEYYLEVEKSKLSPNEEIAKDYILQYKDSYSREVLERGLTKNSIPLNDAKTYLDKYYIFENKNEPKIKHNKKGLGQFFTKIYVWMFIGLLVSLITGLITYFTPLFYIVYGSAIIYYGFVGLELILLFTTQILIEKFSPKISLFLFLLYAAINGVTLLGFFLIYQLSSIFIILFVSASMFLLLATIGFITKKNLSGIAKFFFAGMWGVFIVSLLNIFFQSSRLDFIVSIIAVVVFSGLTMYDNQAYKKLYETIETKEDYKRYSVLGALHMYINFIMIFINLLKLLGRRR